MRTLRLAALLMLALAVALPLPAPFAQAGTPDAPELTDPAGDQTVTRTLPELPTVADEAFDDLDILAAWITAGPGERSMEGPITNITVHVRFSAPWQDTGNLTLTLRADKGPTSVFTSRANGQTVTDSVVGTTGGPHIIAVERDGNDLAVTFRGDPFGAFPASGGDLVTLTTLTATRLDDGNLPVAQDDQSGRDEASTTNAFTMPRPAAVGGAQLVSLGGTVKSSPPRTFNGTQVTVTSDADVEFRVRLTNTGSDPDNFTFAILGGVPSTAPPAPLEAASLVPGASVERSLNVSLFVLPEGDLADGDYVVNVTALSQRGAATLLSLHIVVDLPEVVPPTPREVVPAKLDFLTPAAEAMGFDGPFGKYAEAALLALFVLLTILAIFLLLYLGRTTLDLEPAVEAPLPLPPPEPVAAPGLVRMLDPEAESAAPVVPVPPVPAASPTALRIDSVEHDPAEPTEGEGVETTVVLRNGGGASAQVRVVLLLGDTEVAREAAIVAARATKAVRLQWTAGPGDNRVRVRVLPG